MKKRVFHILNFVAFNLLFFALYLNFIHKDNNNPEPAGHKIVSASVQATTLVNNSNEYLLKPTVKLNNSSANAGAGKKVSIN